MKKMRILPKLHLCCANDELRPIMNHLLVTKDFVVALDGHILIEFKTSELFDEDFIQAMPERFLIHRKNWKALTIKHHFLKFNNSKIEIIRDRYSLFIPIRMETDFQAYPDYEKVFNIKKMDATNNFGIRPDLLKKISVAINSPTVHIFLNGKEQPIIIKSEVEGVRALIMPYKIN